MHLRHTQQHQDLLNTLRKHPWHREKALKTLQQLVANFQQFLQSQAVINNQNSQAINDIRGSITRLTTNLIVREKGKFPAQAQLNPQGQVQQNYVEAKSLNIKPVKAITTLSGRVVDIPTQGPDKTSKVSNPSQDEVKKNQQHLKKRKLSVKKKAFLIEQVNEIIQSNTPPKYKDPGSPTIAFMIENSKIGLALLDLGSSVNLLPYNVYEKLGLGELKPTSITLQLAKRSIKIPRGVVKDVLIQVDKFYYPVDFVVLDIQLSTNSMFQAPAILGRQPHEVEEVHEVNLLESILSETPPLSYHSTDPLIDLKDNFDPIDTFNDFSSTSFIGNQANLHWKLKFEQLPLLIATLKPSE
ncbi:uncharacterized protein LOC121235422 [Juglans microcarpa x Juglans regia]|uniref:uncharacterized protein LOC121235422 n=1 Tax=Juglans microcarpa x Juglans regia TaxID=2249226 RepID=UPI001B7DF7B1|nr:uncharacterized protein LOC121235422 [Juglans microcarpa x Juglans regia]